MNTLTAPGIAHVYRGAGMRDWYRHPGQHSPRGSKMGGKINILNKQISVLCLTNFNFSSEKNKRKGNTLL
jgi:hypothetical protein